MPDIGVCFGLNTYEGAPLDGCVNDMLDMANFAVNDLGFAKENIRLLSDKRATTDAMWERMRWATSSVRSGDRLLVWQSGHGTRVATRNGRGEPDGLDEVFCPIDFDWSDEKLLRDDDYYELFKRIPKGVRVLWGSDSCHSGSLTRGLGRVNLNQKPRFMAPPPDIAWRNASAEKLGHKPTARSTTWFGTLEIAYISGCKYNQTSADATINGRPCGAMTHHFLIAARALGVKKASVKDIVKKMNQMLGNSGFDQEPQCEGSRTGKIIFG